MTITLYTKPAGCFGCTKTKQLLTEAGVPFQEVDITTDTAAFEYVTKELGYSQAPVVVAHGKDGTENRWSGLDKDRIDLVIAIEKSGK
ncbi:glutaredoxin-like protein NrdH [Arthrobacter sp. GAS37]|uniref:glutaredoxin family protein n=1 Tax=Arthrobacter sp. GAS37 TaxID=3156261 RepID=UPI003838D2B6